MSTNTSTNTPTNSEDALALVREIATESPITADGEVNRCRFCESAWVEEDYDTYLHNAAQRKADKDIPYRDLPDRRQSLRVHYHYPECLWVRANEVIRPAVA